MESVELFKLLDEFKKLNEKVDALTAAKPIERPLRSAQTDLLSTALASAQAEFKVAVYNRESGHFGSPYSDLECVISASRPALTKYNLSIQQPIIDSPIDGSKWLETRLEHGSGQFVECRVRIIPVKSSDIQAVNSQLDYEKRMNMVALCGISTSGTDDNAEAAVFDTRETAAKGVDKIIQFPTSKENPKFVITREQYEMLQDELECKWSSDLIGLILDGQQLRQLSDMPKDSFSKTINWVRKTKELRREADEAQKARLNNDR